MNIEHIIDYKNVSTEDIKMAFPASKITGINILRLDKVHPIISGNKWFKLKYYLKEINEKQNVVTFGGAYSNHIVASAFAALRMKQKSIGIIRGEEPEIYSPTLADAREYGMQLIFTSREEYKNKKNLLEKLQLNNENNYIIDEGGLGVKGVKGAKDILLLVPDLSSYTHIICAVGSGTMMAGIVCGALPGQHVVGISTIKGDDKLTQTVASFLPKEHASFEILFNYHFGGYAKKTPELLQFMNEFYNATKIPTDFVYSGKLMHAVKKLIEEHYFQENSKLLVIHCGGLQGNRSLPEGTLIF